tara:strand:- start:2594 stop:2761 length:168 start_codon:yes stop_codon:yes gene_type:complete
MLDEIKTADFPEVASNLLPNGRVQAFTLPAFREGISMKGFSPDHQVLREFPVEHV